MKKDFFHNNLRNSGEFITIYIIFLLASIALTIFVGPSSFPDKNEALEQRSMSFCQYSYRDELYLYSNNSDEVYRIKWYKYLFDDYQVFAEKRGDGTVYYITCLYNEKADEPYYEIKSLKDDSGKIYFDTERYYKIETADAYATLLFFSAIFMLIICYIVISVNIARHPARYKRKTVDLFFKPGYIKDYTRK